MKSVLRELWMRLCLAWRVVTFRVPRPRRKLLMYRWDTVEDKSLDDATAVDLQPYREPSGKCIWLTGVPAAGKTTLAYALREKLIADGINSTVIDADIVRSRDSKRLGFSREDRDIHVKRMGRLATEAAMSGKAAIVACIAPYAAVRAEVYRSMWDLEIEVIEVHVTAPLSVLVQRDPKGLYKKALSGDLTNLTGWDATYEAPDKANALVVDTATGSIAECVSKIQGVFYGKI